MATSIGELKGRITLDDQFSKELDKAGKKIKSIGSALLPMSAAFAGVGIAATKFATDLNKSMANVATLIPNSAERVNELKRDVQDLAVETGKSTEDISGGMYQIISAFGDATDTTEKLRINAMAAAAGLATTTDAISLTSAVTKGYGDTSAAAVEHAADLAFMTVKLGQTTFPELAGSMGRVIPIASALGVSQEELFAGFATLTGVVGDAAETSTGLRAAMGALMKPTEDMQNAMKTLEITSIEAKIAQDGFVQTIRDLVATTDGSIESIAKLFAGLRAQPTVLALINGQAETFNQKFGQMADVLGTTTEAFNEQTAGINKAGFQWEQLKQQLAVVLQRLGDELLPILNNLLSKYLKPMADFLVKVVEGFGKLPEPVQAFVLALGGVLAAAGPVLWIFGQLVSAISVIVANWGAITGVFAAFTGPVGWVVAALIGLVAVWVKWGDDIKRIASETFAAVKSWLVDRWNSDIIQAIVRFVTALGKFWWNGFKIIVDHARVFAREVKEWLVDKLAPVWELAKVAFEAFKAYWMVRIEVIKKAFQIAFGAIKVTLKIVTDSLNTFASAIEKVNEKIEEGRPPVIKTTKAFEDLATPLDNTDEIAARLTEEMVTLAESFDDVAEPVKQFAKISAADVIAKVKQQEATEKLEQATELMGQEITDLAEAEWILKVAAENTAEALERQAREMREAPTKALMKDMDELQKAMVPVINYMEQFINAKPADDGLSAWRNYMKGVQEELNDLAKTMPGRFSIPFKTGLKSALMDLPQVIVGAIQGGGDIFKAVGASIGGTIGSSMSESLTGWLKDRLGKDLGGALGSIIPGLGGILGSALGGLVDKAFGAIGGFFGGLFGDKEKEQLNDIRDEFFKLEGGFEEFSRKMAAVSTEDWAKKIFDAQTVEEFNRLVAEAKGLMDMQGEAQARLQEAVERYGFTVEELGPKFRQQELDKQAEELLTDFRLLEASGINVNTIIERMGPSLNEFLQTAIKTGASVPEAMRPVVEQMIAQGKLLDENGNAYESVEDAGINFAQTMTEQFQTLIEKIDQMVSALLGVPTDINVTTHYNTTGQPPQGGPPNKDYSGGDYPRMKGGGIVTSPTFGLVGEAGPEAVIPLKDMMRSSSDSNVDVMQGMRDLMDDQRRMITQALRDALLQAK